MTKIRIFARKSNRAAFDRSTFCSSSYSKSASKSRPRFDRYRPRVLLLQQIDVQLQKNPDHLPLHAITHVFTRHDHKSRHAIRALALALRRRVGETNVVERIGKRGTHRREQHRLRVRARQHVLRVAQQSTRERRVRLDVDARRAARMMKEVFASV